MPDVPPPPPPVALSIAGSDPSGGAGIQADLAVFAAHHLHGAAAVALITAQNPARVTALRVLDAGIVGAQVEAVLDGFVVRAIKTGALGSADNVGAVASVLDALGDARPPLVVDPVMLATAGDAALIDAPSGSSWSDRHRKAEDKDDDAASATASRDAASAPSQIDPGALSGAVRAYVLALREHLLPLAALVTPNLDEAQVLFDLDRADLASPDAVARTAERLAREIDWPLLLKGGHSDGGGESTTVTDWLIADRKATPFTSRRLDARYTHGTGCALSAAITAQLARGEALPDAIASARSYVHAAILHGCKLGPAGGALGFATAANATTTETASNHPC